MKTGPRLLFGLLRLAVHLALLALETVLWIGLALWGLIVRIKDGHSAFASVKGGSLRCPKGHAVPLSGGTYECSACGFTYQGSILRCGNPECRAITPFVNCPECGLSVRNPFRWGRS